MEDRGFAGLGTERLLIRRFRHDDVHALATYRSDPEVARLQAWDAPFPPEAAARLIASMEDVFPGSPGRWFQFALTPLAGRPLIGDLALRTGADSRQAEIAFTLAREWQGKGYATEALGALLAYAFTDLALHRLYAMTDVRNERSRRLLARSGFRQEGCLVQGAWYKGEWVDECVYAQLRSEWRARREGPPVSRDRRPGR